MRVSTTLLACFAAAGPLYGQVLDGDGTEGPDRPLGTEPHDYLPTGDPRDPARAPWAWSRAVYVPERDQRGAGSSFSGLAVSARLGHTILADPHAIPPLRLNAALGVDLRYHRCLRRGDVPQNWVYALDDPDNPSAYAALVIGDADTLLRASAASLAGGGDGGATDESSLSTAGSSDGARNLIVRPLKESTLPARNLHRFYADLGAVLSVTPHWSLAAAGRIGWSGSKGGQSDHDSEFRAGLAYRFGPGHSLLVGGEYRALTGDPLTEGRTLPVVEWRTDLGPDMALTLGFPRCGVAYAPDRRISLTANYRFPYRLDAELAVDVAPGLGLSLQAWHEARGFSAGSNQACYDHQLGTWFMHPNPWRFRIGEKNHIYIRGGGAAALLTYTHPRWRLDAALGPTWSLPELWHEGTDRRHAHRRARLDAAFGVLASLSWSF